MSQILNINFINLLLKWENTFILLTRRRRHVSLTVGCLPRNNEIYIVKSLTCSCIQYFALYFKLNNRNFEKIPRFNLQHNSHFKQNESYFFRQIIDQSLVSAWSGIRIWKNNIAVALIFVDIFRWSCRDR